MKKIIWMLILAISLSSLPVYGTVEDKKVDISFEDIETLMLEESPTIKANKNILNSLIDGKQIIRDAKDDKKDLEKAISEMNNAIGGLNQAISQQKKIMNDLQAVLEDMQNLPGEDDFSDINIDDLSLEELVELLGQGNLFPENTTQLLLKDPLLYMSLLQTVGFVQGVYEMNLQTLRQNRNSLRDQLDEFDKLVNRDIELDKTILQLEMANKGIIYGAQRLFLGHNSLMRQKNELLSSLDILKSQIDILKLQEELGMINSLSREEVTRQRDDLKEALVTLDDQAKNIRSEFNLMLGRDFHAPLNLIEDIDFDLDLIGEMKYSSDLREAKDNSISIKLKRHDLTIKTNELGWAQRKNDFYELRAAEREYRNVEMEFDQEYRTIEYDFNKSYLNVMNKFKAYEREIDNLDFETRRFNIVDLRHRLGMISDLEFKQAKLTLDSLNNKIQEARQALFTSYMDYELLVDGFNFSQ